MPRGEHRSLNTWEKSVKSKGNVGMSAGEENNDIKSFKNREQISQMTL